MLNAGARLGLISLASPPPARAVICDSPRFPTLPTHGFVPNATPKRVGAGSTCRLPLHLQTVSQFKCHVSHRQHLPSFLKSVTSERSFSYFYSLNCVSRCILGNSLPRSPQLPDSKRAAASLTGLINSTPKLTREHAAGMNQRFAGRRQEYSHIWEQSESTQHALRLGFSDMGTGSNFRLS